VVSALLLQADGRLIVGGAFTQMGGVERRGIARLNADGSLDMGFNPNVDGPVSVLALQADGKLLLGGTFAMIGTTPRNYIARLNADGSLDLGFDPSANFSVAAIAVQANGQIVLGGSFTQIGNPQQARSRIARVNADGTLDASYSPNVSDAVTTLVLQANGMLLLGGAFNSIGSSERHHLARLFANGVLDSNFDPNIDGQFGTLSAIAVQADATLVLAGSFDTVGTTPRNHLARISSDGVVDPGFNPDLNNPVSALAIQSDGKLVLGGSFTTVDGIPRNHIARLRQSSATLQSLSISGNRVTWSRPAGPQAELALPPELSLSSDGINYIQIGTLYRDFGIGLLDSWSFVGALPSNTSSYFLRARGRLTSGQGNGSQGLIEITRQFASALPDRAFADGFE
jgi:uncharacterized delta-60 repeat protein